MHSTEVQPPKRATRQRRVYQQDKPHVRVLYFSNGQYKVTWVALENVTPLDQEEVWRNEEILAISSGAEMEVLGQD